MTVGGRGRGCVNHSTPAAPSRFFHPAAPSLRFRVIKPSLNFDLIYRAISPPVTERHQMQMDAAKRMRFIAFDSLSLIANQRKLTSTQCAFDITRKGILYPGHL